MKPAALYDGFARTANKGQSLILLLIRIYIGWQCIVSGLGHLENFQKTVDQFKEWKIPAPTVSVAVSASTEVVGGALLLIGFGARLAAVPLTFNFLVAMIQTDLAFPGSREKLQNIWNDQSIILTDTAFPFFVASVLVLFFGPGWFSIDGIIKYMRGKKSAAKS
jgi:putative oxidoreductase